MNQIEYKVILLVEDRDIVLFKSRDEKITVKNAECLSTDKSLIGKHGLTINSEYEMQVVENERDSNAVWVKTYYT